MAVRDLIQAAAGASGGVIQTDEYFNQTVLLLHGDGTNGAQNNTFVDSSPNNFAITRTGNATQGSFSPFTHGGSAYFDGTGDELETDSAVISSMEYSIEAFVYTLANTQGYIAAQYTAGNGSRTVFLYRETTGVLYFYHPSTGSVSAGSLSLNQWYHVLITRDSGGRTRIFIDGVLKSTFTTSYTPEGSSLSIGGTGEAGSNFNGYISNFRALDGSIPTDYQTSSITVNAAIFTPPTTPLTAVSGTSLLTCQSNRFIDNSSNNFTLTVNGNTSVQRFSPFNPTAPYSASTIGGSGYFDGTGDYLSVPTTSGALNQTGDFTYEMWMYWITMPTTGYQNISGQGAGGQSSYGLFAGNAAANTWSAPYVFKLNIANQGDALVGNTELQAGQWYHLAHTRTSGVNRLFVNGVVQTNTYTDSTNRTFNGNPYLIANNSNCYVSNFRFIQGTSLYTSTFTPPTAPLTAITNTSLLLNFTNAGIFDSTAKNNIETIGNARISTSQTKYGTGALYFDGSGDWLEVEDKQSLLSFGTGAFTIEAFVYPTAVSSDNFLIWIYGNTVDIIAIIINIVTGIATFRLRGTGLSQIDLNSSSPNLVNKNTWTHIAAVRNGTEMALYINGIKKSTTISASAAFNENASNWFGMPRIGAKSNLDGGYFNGYIDDLRITKGIARYTTNFTPPEAPHPDQ